MADESTPSVVTPAAVPPAASPAPASGDAVSAAAPAAAPAASPAPVSATPPAVTPMTAESTVVDSTPTTVLGGLPPVADKSAEKPVEPVKTPDAAKPADANAAETKKEEGSQSAEPAPLPTYQDFTLPEGTTLEPAKLGEFTKILGEHQNLTKADQAAMQTLGQKLVDKHVAEVNEAVSRLNDYYQDAFKKQTSEWKDAAEKDPELLGGNRRDTTLKELSSALHEGAGPKAKEYQQLMERTGLGNHPEHIRLLANLGRIITDLRTKYESESGVRPLPATKPEAKPQSKVAKRYGANT